MASTPFTKLLHAYYPDAGCGSLVIQTEFNNTRCTYRVPTATTQLKYLEPDVFETLSQLGLKFFLGIGPWGVLPELVDQFLTSYNPETGHVRMPAFADTPPVEFQFTVADVCTTLQLPGDGLPFRTTRSPSVVPSIIPTVYAEYAGREGWRFTEIPPHLHDRCSAIAQIGDTASTDAISRISGEFLKWAHDPQPVQWAHEFVRRVREWQTRPKSVANFAWFLTRYLCAKFNIGPPPPPFIRCQERCRKTTMPGQPDRIRVPERDFLRQVHQGERDRPSAHKQPQITHVTAEDTIDTPEDITQRTKEFQARAFTPEEIQELSRTFYYMSPQTMAMVPHTRSCTTEPALRDTQHPMDLSLPTVTTSHLGENPPASPGTTTQPTPPILPNDSPQPRPTKLARHCPPRAPAPEVRTPFLPPENPNPLSSPHSGVPSPPTADTTLTTTPNTPTPLADMVTTIIKMTSVVNRHLLQVHAQAQQTAHERQEAYTRNEALAAEVRNAHHTNACQAAAYDLLKQELIAEQTRRHELAEEFLQAQTTWRRDHEQAAQTHAELSAEYGRLTTLHQRTEAQLAALTVDLSARSEALAHATATTHTLTNELTTLKVAHDALLQQVEVANERNRCLLIKHHTQCAELEKDITQLRTTNAALEHALISGAPDTTTPASPVPPNMIQALSVYVTSTSQLSELFSAPRTPCNLLASATCVLRSLAATRRVFFDEVAPPRLDDVHPGTPGRQPCTRALYVVPGHLHRTPATGR